ncbi:unnamed protein product, partial [Rotaria magnacalcarata]
MMNSSLLTTGCRLGPSCFSLLNRVAAHRTAATATSAPVTSESRGNEQSSRPQGTKDTEKKIKSARVSDSFVLN